MGVARVGTERDYVSVVRRDRTEDTSWTVEEHFTSRSCVRTRRTMLPSRLGPLNSAVYRLYSCSVTAFIVALEEGGGKCCVCGGRHTSEVVRVLLG